MFLTMIQVIGLQIHPWSQKLKWSREHLKISVVRSPLHVVARTKLKNGASDYRYGIKKSIAVPGMSIRRAG